MEQQWAVEYISGCPTYGKFFRDINNSTTEMVKACDKDYIVVLSSNNTKIQGLVNGHAYTVLKVFKYKGKNVFQVRNTWGNT
jgi:hypothetical protein